MADTPHISPQLGISSSDRVQLRESLAGLHIVLGVFVQQLAHRERDVSEADIERLLLKLSATLDYFLNRPSP